MLLVLFSQLLVVILLLAGAEYTWLRFGLMSLFVQWVTLGSAGLLCVLRARMQRLPLVPGALLAFSGVMAVTLLASAAGEVLVPQGPGVALRILGHLTISAIITALLLRYFYVQQSLRLQEQAELHARIQALQSRIRPHFLFNSMNSIASLIAVDPDTAETVVEDLSELFRASLNEAGSHIPMTEELALCRRYIRIEALRLGERLNMVWEIDEQVSTARIPLLTLQPLLENAIYHGIQPLPEGGTIMVSAHADADRLTIEIRNPVPPSGSPAHGAGNHMALHNIRSRLAALYGPHASLHTHIEADTFRACLSLPRTPPAV